MRWECRERFPRHRLQRKPQVSDPDMHHGTCVTHVPWCMSGSPTCNGRGKRSRHSRHMRNPQFYVSGKRPMAPIFSREDELTHWYLCSLWFVSSQFTHMITARFRWNFCFCVESYKPWWRHQMETFSALLDLCCGEFTGHRWIPRTKASDAELWCFLW